jgi:lysophospholipase L1-like esterase
MTPTSLDPPESFPVAHGRSIAALVGIGVGIGAGPALGGLTFALCAWQARRARRHPGVAPDVVATSGLTGPVGEQPLRVTWLGDSLAAGIGADHVDDTPAHLVARMLDRPVHLTVLAVPGARSADVLADQVPRVGEREDLVVVAVGSNDVASRTRRRSYARQLDAILAASAGTPTIVLSLPDITMADRIGQPLRWFAGLRARHFEAARERVARRHDHVTSVDIASRPPHISRRVGKEMLCADRFHPGPLVYRVWAERIAEAGQVLLAGAGPIGSAALVPAPVVRQHPR